MVDSPMVTEIVGHPRSLYLMGAFVLNNNTYSVSNAFFSFF